MSKIVRIVQQKEDLRSAINYLDMISRACESVHPVLGKAAKVTLKRPESFIWAWEQVRSLLEEKELIPNPCLNGLSAVTYVLDEMHDFQN